MANTVRFRFQSETNYRTVKFNEYYISVGELKRIIAERTGLQANELVLVDNDAPSGHVLADDGAMINRNATLTVRRRAAAATSAVAAATTRMMEMRQEERRMLEVATTTRLQQQQQQQSKKRFGWQQRLCYGCKQAGHTYHDCPLQANKRIKAPVGIPATKIQRNADGSLYLPDGTLGEVTTNTKAFARFAQILGDPTDDELIQFESSSSSSAPVQTADPKIAPREIAEHITRDQIMAMLPELRDIIAGMSADDVLRMYGSGRPEWDVDMKKKQRV